MSNAHKKDASKISPAHAILAIEALEGGFDEKKDIISDSEKEPENAGISGESLNSDPQEASSDNVSLPRENKQIFSMFEKTAPAEHPTQKGPEGISFDFNYGIRLKAEAGHGIWRVTFLDKGTDTILYQHTGPEFFVGSFKKYFLDARLEIDLDNKPIWKHDYAAKDKKIAIIFPANTLGDSLGWFPYAVRFAEKHACHLSVVMGGIFKELLGPLYPHITFLEADEFKDVRGSFYATYYLGLYFSDETNEWQPADFRMVGLHRTAGHILGVDPTETPAKVVVDEKAWQENAGDIVKQEKGKKRKDRYVVIAVQGSSACKMWNNPSGWMDVVGWLKEKGWRVVCIDRDPVTGQKMNYTTLPWGCEDQTGLRPLAERAAWIKNADFFVGLSSGLSWLAWSVGTPVVMISGFTRPENEFYTPWRVFSAHPCNSCWHDVRVPFQHKNWFFCPRHEGTEKQFECTRLIPSSFVISMIENLCAEKKLTYPINQTHKAAKKEK